MSKKLTPAARVARFWMRVRKGEDQECWPWLGPVNGSGYGTLGIEGNTVVGAHVFSYTLAYGPLPSGINVLHRCDVRRCCNPRHLWAGTQGDNINDAWTKGRNIFQTNPEIRPKGEQHKLAKLSEQQVRQIRSEYASKAGDTYTLAKKYNISQRAAWLVINRKTYKCVS